MVQIGIEAGGIELLKRLGVFGRDGSVADVLADHGSVLAFHQRIVGGAVGPRLGELHQQLVEQPGHGVIEKLGTVVAVKAQDAEGN